MISSITNRFVLNWACSRIVERMINMFHQVRNYSRYVFFYFFPLSFLLQCDYLLQSPICPLVLQLYSPSCTNLLSSIPPLSIPLCASSPDSLLVPLPVIPVGQLIPGRRAPSDTARLLNITGHRPWWRHDAGGWPGATDARRDRRARTASRSGRTTSRIPSLDTDLL